MKNTSTFTIDYKGKKVPVTANLTGKENEGDYTVHFEDRVYTIQLKEDTEGASHWFEKNTEEESAFSREIGQAIESAGPLRK